MDKQEHNKGFTLIEIIIVISILAIMTIISVNPNMVNKKSNKNYYKEVVSNYKTRAFYHKTNVSSDDKVSDCNINGLYFNENGNVNKAIKVYCNDKYMFNISLGLGNIYE